MIPMPFDNLVTTPIEIVIQPEADPKPDAERNKEPGPRRTLHIDDLRFIDRDVDHLRTRRNDFDDSAVVHDGLLWRRLQVAKSQRLVAQTLDGIHHILLLIDEGLADLRGPREVVIHELQNRRETRQGLDALV